MSSPERTAFTDAAATWNKRYSQADFLFGRAPNAWLAASAAQLPRQGSVLCVADGEGRNSVWLAQQGLQVDAFDIAEAGVAKARALAAEAGVAVHFEVADCDTRDWPADRYDAVVAVFVQFADPAQRTRLFANMVHTLKPGGLLLLQGYTPKQLDYKTGGPPFLSHLYTEDLLREAFAGLQTLELRSYEAEISEGTGHHGRSALIGLLARKP